MYAYTQYSVEAYTVECVVAPSYVTSVQKKFTSSRLRTEKRASLLKSRV